MPRAIPTQPVAPISSNSARCPSGGASSTASTASTSISAKMSSQSALGDKENPGDLRVKSSKKPSKHIPNSTSHRNGWHKVEPFKSLEVFFLGKHGETHVRSLVPDNQGSVVLSLVGLSILMGEWLIGYCYCILCSSIGKTSTHGLSWAPFCQRWKDWILQEVDFPTTQHLISKHHPTSLDLEMPWVIRFCDCGVRSNTMRQIGEELKRFTEHRTTKPHSRWASGSRELHWRPDVDRDPTRSPGGTDSIKGRRNSQLSLVECSTLGGFGCWNHSAQPVQKF